MSNLPTFVNSGQFQRCVRTRPVLRQQLSQHISDHRENLVSSIQPSLKVFCQEIIIRFKYLMTIVFRLRNLR